MGNYVGGAKRDRTADLLHAMQALSQLSYGPIRPLAREYKAEMHCPVERLIKGQYQEDQELNRNFHTDNEIFCASAP